MENDYVGVIGSTLPSMQSVGNKQTLNLLLVLKCAIILLKKQTQILERCIEMSLQLQMVNEMSYLTS